MKNKITILAILAIIANANEAPKPDYNNYFTNEDKIGVSNSGPVMKNNINGSLISNDTLPVSKIQGKIQYINQPGFKANTKIKISQFGTRVIQNLDTNKTTRYFYEHNSSKDYTESRKELSKQIQNVSHIKYLIKKAEQKKQSTVSLQKQLSDAETLLNKRYQETRGQAKKQTFSNRETMDTYSKNLLKNVQPVSQGRSIVNKRFLSKNPNSKDNNVSNFYKSHFGSSPDFANVKNIKDTNVGKIKKAYTFVKSLEQLAKSKLNSGVISCYISRKMIPSYYCPYPDMSHTLYPDYNNKEADPYKLSSVVAEKTCNDNCFKKRACIEHKVIDKKKIKNNQTIKIFPYNDEKTHITLTTSPLMQIDSLDYDIEIKPSKNFDGNMSKFNDWLSNAGLKYRTDLHKIDDRLSKDNQVIPLFTQEETKLKSNLIHKTYKISDVGKKWVFNFYKPYKRDTTEGYGNILNQKVLRNIDAITIKNITIHYTNNSVYFCPFKQLVDNKSECPNGKIQDINEKGSIFHVCVNPSHAIGPDPYTGGFYSEESCSNACYEYRDCKATYRQYAKMDNNLLFKAKVGCVDSDQNSGCSDDLCKSYFADYKKRPINEIVIQNDNTRVYTVKNKTVTGEMRPKIDYDKEINSVTTDYKLTFQEEMKDEAYKNMIKNQSYDKIKYLIGETSPEKKAYIIVNNGDSKDLYGLLKPQSSQIDDNNYYNIYNVVKYEQTFKPAYGIYMVDGHYIDATKQPIVFKDIGYLIKSTTGYKLFKQVLYAKVKKKKKVLICKGSDGKWTDNVYNASNAVEDNCRVQTRIYWSNVPAYSIDRNVFYDLKSDSFLNYDTNTQANYFKAQKFTKNSLINKYLLMQDIYSTISDTSGALIHSQKEKDHGASTARIYKGSYISAQRGYIANIWSYLFYSSSALSYKDIVDNYLTDNNIIWELANQHKYPKSIKEDGEIDNNIKAFISGDTTNTTVETDIAPGLKEEGKKVFKFIFLYDKDKDPFKE